MTSLFTYDLSRAFQSARTLKLQQVQMRRDDGLFTIIFRRMSLNLRSVCTRIRLLRNNLVMNEK